MPQWLIDFGNWLYDICYAAVSTVGVLCENILLTVIDGFFVIGRLALDGVGALLQPFGIQSLFNALPPDVIGMLAAIGLPEALGMIISSITVRLFMQLIPFVRLGS
jgi:hypothetical protein